MLGTTKKATVCCVRNSSEDPPFPCSSPIVPFPAPRQLNPAACVLKQLRYNTGADVKRILPLARWPVLLDCKHMDQSRLNIESP
jgi:hypothetical protein